MQWKDLYPSDRQPTMDEIEDYIDGEAKSLWKLLIRYMDTAYHAKPKFSYSVCAGKPGWNIKFQKNGQSFGTFYPEEHSFSVFLVIGYKLEPLMPAVLPQLGLNTQKLYQKAEDYMKMGRWMMLRIKNAGDLDDYKKLISVKRPPKLG